MFVCNGDISHKQNSRDHYGMDKPMSKSQDAIYKLSGLPFSFVYANVHRMTQTVFCKNYLLQLI